MQVSSQETGRRWQYVRPGVETAIFTATMKPIFHILKPDQHFYACNLIQIEPKENYYKGINQSADFKLLQNSVET